MENLFNPAWILKNPTLKRAQIQILKYPDEIVNSEKDLEKTKQSKPKSLEEYLFSRVWGSLTRNKKVYAIGVQDLYLNKVSFAYSKDVQIGEISEVLKQFGIEASIIEESEINGKFGFYRF